jgi:hypothetical protein
MHRPSPLQGTKQHLTYPVLSPSGTNATPSTPLLPSRNRCHECPPTPTTASSPFHCLSAAIKGHQDHHRSVLHPFPSPASLVHSRNEPPLGSTVHRCFPSMTGHHVADPSLVRSRMESPAPPQPPPLIAVSTGELYRPRRQATASSRHYLGCSPWWTELPPRSMGHGLTP